MSPDDLFDGKLTEMTEVVGRRGNSGQVFVSFKADGFVAQLNTQKQNCRAFKELLIDTQHITISTIV
jgi:hypothetical protein